MNTGFQKKALVRIHNPVTCNNHTQTHRPRRTHTHTHTPTHTHTSHYQSPLLCCNTHMFHYQSQGSLKYGAIFKREETSLLLGPLKYGAIFKREITSLLLGSLKRSSALPMSKP